LRVHQLPKALPFNLSVSAEPVDRPAEDDEKVNVTFHDMDPFIVFCQAVNSLCHRTRLTPTLKTRASPIWPPVSYGGEGGQVLV
jgi:hypothetical protein